MSYESIIFKVDEGIATITFNRPKALNALNHQVWMEFSAALDEITANEDIRVLILTGAGEKAFIAGADITELTKCNPLQCRQLGKKGQDLLLRMEGIAIPVIGAVNGFALGGGCEMAMACDFIYASENAKFGLPEITLGLIPGFGGTQRLPRMVGKNIAKEMLFTGKMISAAEAKEVGLVNKVCAQDKLMDEVMKTAKAIASKGKYSLQAGKRVVNSGLDVDLATGCKIEADAFGLCMASEDGKEGTSAFLEKRKANFKGKLT
ncbi:Crotonyl-CoA hydratase [Candidatus Magnetomoraceae bacterium gMMP-15]